MVGGKQMDKEAALIAARGMRAGASPMVQDALDIVTNTLVQCGWDYGSALILPWAIYGVSHADKDGTAAEFLADMCGYKYPGSPFRAKGESN